MTVTESIAKYIDHTSLHPQLNQNDVKQLCLEANEHQFASVCIPPFFVKQAAQLLEESTSAVCTVIGFPMGYSCTSSKVEEVKRAIDEGADEIDAVVNLAAIKSGEWNFVENDIKSMIVPVHFKSKIMKLIVEIGLLTIEELKRLADICFNANIDFLKTSTGFHNQPATIEQVKLLSTLTSSTNTRVKASGGIRTFEQAQQMIAAGAHRIGTSSALEF